ncbi:MAG TPA: ROK family protein [Pelobium sp.]|nr:ROK family protein [Pelobium sp.]
MKKPKNLVLGADVGGSHITTALIDMESQTVLKETLIRERVNPHGTPQEIINDWSNCILRSMEGFENQVTEFGIAMPGPFDYEKGISKIKGLSKFDALYGLNVKDMLATNLDISSTQIKMMNDAGCFLQGEVFSGSARGFNHVIGLTLGTGLGTARYHNGVGEDANLWCMPFKDTIAEDYISTRWFVSRYLQLTGLPIKDVKALAEIFKTDQNAPLIFKEFGQNLALFLMEFIRMEQPEVIIIGGNVANAYPLFKEEIVSCFEKRNIHTSIYLSKLNEEAALLGAASLWVKDAVTV